MPLAMVLETGLEPARLTALASKASVAAITPLEHLVGSAGLEPARARAHEILSLGCLPIPPRPRILSSELCRREEADYFVGRLPGPLPREFLLLAGLTPRGL